MNINSYLEDPTRDKSLFEKDANRDWRVPTAPLFLRGFTRCADLFDRSVDDRHMGFYADSGCRNRRASIYNPNNVHCERRVPVASNSSWGVSDHRLGRNHHAS